MSKNKNNGKHTDAAQAVFAQAAPKQKVLVALFKTLGDVLMGTTVVRAIKERTPDCEIDFVTQAQNKNILEGNPDINKIIIADNYYDASLIYLDGGYDVFYRLGMANYLDTCWHHIEEHKYQHLVEWYAKRAGIKELNDKNIYITLTPNDIADVDDYWNDIPQDKKYIAIHTTSGVHPGVGPIASKDWPINRFEFVAQQLINAGFGVIQVGAFSDKKIKVPGVIDFTGKVSFKQTAEVIRRCIAYIGVDSGPAYLAGWSGVPTFLIMGSTQNTCDHSGPSVGPRNDNVFYINSKKPNHTMCSPTPCYNKCQIGKQIGCIEDVAPAVVLGAFQQIVMTKTPPQDVSSTEAPSQAPSLVEAK
jgi:ADP-heptose:LPS heptosyltransferase